VQEAMNIVYGLTHDHLHRSDDELTLQRLGIRLFNASAASVNLALSGYYQIAFAQLRDIVETYFLLDYFSTNKDKNCCLEDGRPQSKFRPYVIRNELDKRDGDVTAWLEEMVKLLGHRAFVYARHFEDVAPDLEVVKKQYFYMMKAWLAKLSQACNNTVLPLSELDVTK
jgi:hypothetical protein